MAEQPETCDVSAGIRTNLTHRPRLQLANRQRTCFETG
jgi:hypothetical protein